MVLDDVKSSAAMLSEATLLAEAKSLSSLSCSCVTNMSIKLLVLARGNVSYAMEVRVRLTC